MKITLPDKTKLYFDVHGSQRTIKGTTLIEKPTLIFLHGGPGLADHNLYSPFWSRFKDIAQVIFIDLRGHGQSEGWNQTDKFTLKSWASDIKDFCDQLSIVKPIVLGFSFGGWVALQYAIDHPDHPGALILCNSEAHVNVELRANSYRDKAIRKGMTPDQADKVAAIVRDLGNGKFDNSKTADIYLDTCAPLFSEKPGAPELEAIWELCKQNPLAWEIFDKNEQYKFDHTPCLYRIKAHVLSISGELDVEHPAVCAKAMCNAMINAASVKHVVLPGAGDPVDHDNPEGVTNAIRSFIFELYPQTKNILDE